MQLIAGIKQRLWKIVTNPTFEVIAAILLVLIAVWIVVQTEVDLKHHQLHFPLLFGHK
jgi:ABC-type nickel/cobalt efflux system permease component RcnA